MTGQFSRSHFTAQPAKFKTLFQLKTPPLLKPGDNQYLANLVSWSILQVIEPWFFHLI